MNDEYMNLNKNDTPVIIKVKNAIIAGKVNVDPYSEVGYFFNKDINDVHFIPVYDAEIEGVKGRTVILNKSNVEWLSPDVDSDSIRDTLIKPVKLIPVTITLRDAAFKGVVNLGHYNRLSDRLNDRDNHFIPLMNVDYEGKSRTIFIHVGAILSVYDVIDEQNSEDATSDSD